MSQIRNLLSQVMPQPQSAEQFNRGVLRDQIGAIGADRLRFESGAAKSRVASANSANRLRRRTGAASSSAVAQEFATPATSFAGALDNAQRRAKVRTRLAQQGDKAVEHQGLRDRIRIASQSRARRGDLINASSSASNIREGVNLGVADARQTVANANADMFGGILGGVTGVFANKEGREGVSNLFGHIKNMFSPKPAYTGGGLDL